MSGLSETLEERPDSAAAPAAGRVSERAPLRAWPLDRAVILEAVEPGAGTRYVIKCGESWAWCAEFDGALTLVWTALRSKAALPAQWGEAEADLAGQFRQHWPELQRLPAGQWHPRPPAADA